MENTKTFTTIYIVRHGQSLGNVAVESNATNVDLSLYGELQSPLTEYGRQQAEKLAKQFENIHFTAILSSDLRRAHETAEIISAKRNLTVTTVSTIRERNFGDAFYAKLKRDRKELEEALTNLNEIEKLKYKYSPDGESALDAVNRFMTFLHEIIPLYQGKTILVVNHGNVMRSFLIYLGWATYDELPAGTIKNTGYFVLETDGKTFNIKETQGIQKEKLPVENEE